MRPPRLGGRFRVRMNPDIGVHRPDCAQAFMAPIGRPPRTVEPFTPRSLVSGQNLRCEFIYTDSPGDRIGHCLGISGDHCDPDTKAMKFLDGLLDSGRISSSTAKAPSSFPSAMSAAVSPGTKNSSALFWTTKYQAWRTVRIWQPSSACGISCGPKFETQ
jgi:hypothetical protein